MQLYLISAVVGLEPMKALRIAGAPSSPSTITLRYPWMTLNYHHVVLFPTTSVQAPRPDWKRSRCGWDSCHAMDATATLIPCSLQLDDSRLEPLDSGESSTLIDLGEQGTLSQPDHMLFMLCFAVLSYLVLSCTPHPSIHPPPIPYPPPPPSISLSLPLNQPEVHVSMDLPTPLLLNDINAAHPMVSSYLLAHQRKSNYVGEAFMFFGYRDYELVFRWHRVKVCVAWSL